MPQKNLYELLKSADSVNIDDHFLRFFDLSENDDEAINIEIFDSEGVETAFKLSKNNLVSAKKAEHGSWIVKSEGSDELFTVTPYAVEVLDR